MSRTELLTVTEAAERLRLHQSTVYRLITRRDIEAVRIGRRALIKAAAVEEYIARHTHQPATRRGRR